MGSSADAAFAEFAADAAALVEGLVGSAGAHPYVLVVAGGLLLPLLFRPLAGPAVRFLLGALALGALGVFLYGYLLPQYPPVVQAVVRWGSVVAVAAAVLTGAAALLWHAVMLWAENRCTRWLETHSVTVRLRTPEGAFSFLGAVRRLTPEQREVLARLVDDAGTEDVRIVAPRDLLRYVDLAVAI